MFQRVPLSSKLDTKIASDRHEKNIACLLPQSSEIVKCSAYDQRPKMAPQHRLFRSTTLSVLRDSSYCYPDVWTQNTDLQRSVELFPRDLTRATLRNGNRRACSWPNALYLRAKCDPEYKFPRQSVLFHHERSIVPPPSIPEKYLVQQLPHCFFPSDWKILCSES